MCSVGEHLGDRLCGTDLFSENDFSQDDWKLLKRRSGRSSIRSVCGGHKLSLLTLYSSRIIYCCNPLPNRHQNGPAKGTKIKDLALYRKAKGTLALIPGKRLCKHCFEAIQKLLGDTEEVESSQSPEETPESSQEVGACNVVQDVTPEKYPGFGQKLPQL